MEPLHDQNGAEDEEEEVEYEKSLPRRLADIDPGEFEPIWVRGEPIPEGLSDEVKEEIINGPENIIQMAGSLRTILYMHKCDDLVTLIGDPACQLEDEIISVPIGTGAIGFILRNYVPDGVIPRYFMRKYLGFDTSPETIHASPVFEIPSVITGDLATRRIQDIYPNARPQCFPESVHMVRLKAERNFEKFEASVHKAFGGELRNKPGLFFHGLSLKVLSQSLTFSLPAVDSQSADNEFGPAIYTSESFEVAYRYSKPNGAIMVFSRMDARDLNVWRPNLEEWNHLVATWLGLPLDDISVSPEFKNADLIVGPMARNPDEARRKKCFPAQDEGKNQSAFVSYKSCERLMASLTAIIYMTS